MRYERSMWEHGGRMSATARSCASCGNDLPVGARFCSSCGSRTVAVEGPVTWSISERRVFGVVPGASAIAVVRSRTGRLLAVLQARTRLVVTLVQSWVSAAVARLRLWWHLRRLDHERAQALHALGDAVYRDDGDEASRARSHIGDLERRMEALNMELQQVERDQQERIVLARIEGSPTNVVEPEPPIVPEPEPVPHEPPGPVIVPEPEPEPHVPPGPVIVPEPEPPTPES
jgi:hypothetical protein